MVRGWLAVALVLPLVAGCLESGPGRELRDRWDGEAAAQEPFGAPATLQVDGLFTLEGKIEADLAAPFSVRVAKALGSERPYVLLHGARVPGVGNGTVAIEATELLVASGTLEEASFARAVPGRSVDLYPAAGKDDRRATVRDVPDWEGIGHTDFFGERMQGTLREAELSGFSRAALLRGRDVVPLDAPLRLTAEGVSLATESSFQVPSVRLVAARFHLGGPLSGLVVADGVDVRDPEAVTGRDAAFLAQPGSLEGSFRLTQAVSGGRLLREGRIELAVADAVVRVSNGTGSLEVSYRERSFHGDAVLSTVRLQGAPTGTLLTVASAPAVLRPAAPAPRTEGPVGVDPSCWVLCGLGPRELPQWIDAGSVGRFDILMQGLPGTSATMTLVLEGNFPSVVLPVTVEFAPAAGQAAPGAAVPGSLGQESAAEGAGGLPLWAVVAGVSAAFLAAVAVAWRMGVASSRRAQRSPPLPAARPQAAPPRQAGGPHPVRRTDAGRRGP